MRFFDGEWGRGIDAAVCRCLGLADDALAVRGIQGNGLARKGRGDARRQGRNARNCPVPDDLTLPPEPDANPSRRMSHFEIGPFTRLCEALRDQVEGRLAQTPVKSPTFRDGLACMRVIDAMRASAASRRCAASRLSRGRRPSGGAASSENPLRDLRRIPRVSLEAPRRATAVAGIASQISAEAASVA